MYRQCCVNRRQYNNRSVTPAQHETTEAYTVIHHDQQHLQPISRDATPSPSPNNRFMQVAKHPAMHLQSPPQHSPIDCGSQQTDLPPAERDETTQGSHIQNEKLLATTLQSQHSICRLFTNQWQVWQTLSYKHGRQHVMRHEQHATNEEMVRRADLRRSKTFSCIEGCLNLMLN